MYTSCSLREKKVEEECARATAAKQSFTQQATTQKKKRGRKTLNK
jgi:hypothetical protein